MRGRVTPSPDVVFFGENVPKGRVDAAFEALRQADEVLVVGSSLTGFRVVQAAARDGKEMAAVKLGRTRADERLGCPTNNRRFAFLISQPLHAPRS